MIAGKIKVVNLMYYKYKQLEKKCANWFLQTLKLVCKIIIIDCKKKLKKFISQTFFIMFQNSLFKKNSNTFLNL